LQKTGFTPSLANLCPLPLPPWPILGSRMIGRQDRNDCRASLPFSDLF
jgi:hypothetical protein